VSLLLFHLEILGLSGLIVGVYSLKPRLGIAPMYLAIGMMIAFLMLGGRLVVDVPVIGGEVASYTSINHLALILTTMVLIYTLEGTGEARRLIGAIAVASVFLFVLRLLLSSHLNMPGVDLSLYGRERWIGPDVRSNLISTIAFLVDGVAILVVYQALLKRARWLPQVVTLTVAVVAATMTDAVVYGGLSGRLELSELGGHFVAKLTAGIAAAIPAAAYIAYQFRNQPEELRNGVLERGTFSIIALRKKVREVETNLARSRAEYAHVRSVFSRYVVPDVVDEILRDTSQLKLGGQSRVVTILFSDIRGYSTLSEHMSPEETISLLNEYFGAMSDVILAERGTIIEFEGDAILTVFGAPLAQHDHAERALRTALAMFEAVERQNRLWDESGTSRHWKKLFEDSQFQIRIGIHTGPVVVGNIGSEQRTKYAVIGDTVNTTSRVETLNKQLKTTLLLTDATVKAIGPSDFPLKDLGQYHVKGRSEAVHVYTIEDL
jgi:class 3 adenylate cyclase